MFLRRGINPKQLRKYRNFVFLWCFIQAFSLFILSDLHFVEDEVWITYIPHPTVTSNLFSIPIQVKIKKVIKNIPKDQVISFHYQNYSLPKPENKHIKLFLKNLNYGMRGFLPTLPHNENFLGAYSPTLEDDLNWQYWNYCSGYVLLKNMYTTYSGAFCTSNYTFVDLEIFRKVKRIRDHQNGHVVAYFEQGISLGHTQVFQVGHFFQDILAPLLMFPKDVLKSSYIIVNREVEDFIDCFGSIDVEREQVILLSRCEWIFCEKLYTPVFPLPHLQHYGWLIKDVIIRLRKYFKVENVIPTKYFFTNRLSTRRRHISNMKDVMNAVQKKFPKYHFEYFDDDETIQGSAYMWSQARFIFAPTGSNCAKHMFMSGKTVMIVALGNAFDNCMALCAAIHDVYTIFFRITGMTHGSFKHNKCDIGLGVTVASLGIYCLENGHFDPNALYYDPMDILLA